MIGWESFIDKLTSEYGFEGWIRDKRDGRQVGVTFYKMFGGNWAHQTVEILLVEEKALVANERAYTKAKTVFWTKVIVVRIVPEKSSSRDNQSVNSGKTMFEKLLLRYGVYIREYVGEMVGERGCLLFGIFEFAAPLTGQPDWYQIHSGAQKISLNRASCLEIMLAQSWSHGLFRFFHKMLAEKPE